MDASANAMTFNVLVKLEGGVFTAHCMELDIVAEAPTLDKANKEIGDLIVTAVDYAFSNQNLEYLYRPAPPEVWEEFYRCQQDGEERVEVPRSFGQENSPDIFVPPWIIAKTCRLSSFRV